MLFVFYDWIKFVAKELYDKVMYIYLPPDKILRKDGVYFLSTL